MPEQVPDTLIASYLEGELTPEQAQRLSAWITADPANAAYVARLGLVERGLNQHFLSQGSGDLLADLVEMEANAQAAGPVDITEPVRFEARSKKIAMRQRAQAAALAQASVSNSSDTLVIPKLAAVIAFAAMLGLVAWLGRHGPDTTQPTDAGNLAEVYRDSSPSHTSTPAMHVAVVQSSVDAQWVGLAGNRGNNLHSGETVTLSEGLAEIAFGDGVTVIIQGPVTFTPTGANAMQLDSGRAVATVPSRAHGFTITAPGCLITDYGTEFGVQVNTDGQTLAQAHSGQIGLTPTGATQEVRLFSGDAVVVDPLGRVREVPHNDLAFVRSEEYKVHQGAEQSAYAGWLAYSYKLRRDPAVVAYYTFDNRDESADQLINRASPTHGRYDGRLGVDHNPLTLPEWTAGRFEEKQALRFGLVGPGLAKTVQIDGFGDYAFGDSITLAAWVRIPEETTTAGGGTLLSLRDLPMRHMGFQFSLFLESDPYPQTLQFGTGNERAVDHVNEYFRYGPTPWVRPGAWVMAAVVYEAGGVTFYLNGRSIGSVSDLGPLLRTRPGTPLLIGRDPYQPNAQHPQEVEAFMGDIDEVLILKRAMSPEEINQMYLVGRPDSF